MPGRKHVLWFKKSTIGAQVIANNGIGYLRYLTKPELAKLRVFGKPSFGSLCDLSPKP